MNVDNNGFANLVFSAITTGPFNIIAPVPVNEVVAPGGSTSFDVEFCPTVDDGQLQTGTAVITSNDVTNPTVTINLEGQETP